MTKLPAHCYTQNMDTQTVRIIGYMLITGGAASIVTGAMSYYTGYNNALRDVAKTDADTDKMLEKNREN